MKYSQLNRPKNEIADTADERLKLGLLYEGGNQPSKNAKVFFKKGDYELQGSYAQRIEFVPYVNIFGEIVDRYIAQLYAKPLEMINAKQNHQSVKQAADNLEDSIQEKPSFWQSLAADADGKGSSFPEVIKCATKDALIYRTGYLGFDFPKVDQLPQNLAEEEALEADRAFLYHIPNTSFFNWQVNADGSLRWVLLRDESCELLNITDPKATRTVTFTYWEKAESVSFAVYSFSVPEDKEIDDKTPCVIVDSGNTSFANIPILPFSLPRGLCLGDKIGTSCADYYVESCDLIYAERKILHAVPVIKLGPEATENTIREESGAQTSAGAESQWEQKGMIVISSSDELSILEPTGNCFMLVNQQLKEKLDNIHRVAYTMDTAPSSTSKALHRSGESKQQDQDLTSIILTHLGRYVKDYANKVYQAVASARKENVTFHAHGLDSYEVEDRNALIQESLSYDPIASLLALSPVAHKAYAYRLLTSIAPVSPADAQLVAAQISENIDSGKALHPTEPKEPVDTGKDDPSDESSAEDDSEDKPQATA